MRLQTYTQLLEKVIELKGARLRYSTNVLCLAPFDSNDAYTFSPIANLKVRKHSHIKLRTAEESLKIIKGVITFLILNPSVEETHYQRGRYLIIKLTDDIGESKVYRVKIFNIYFGTKTGRSTNEFNYGG